MMRVALDVVEDVAFVRFGQDGEAASRHHGLEFEVRLAGLAGVLQARLQRQLLARGDRHALHVAGVCGESGQRGDPGGLQLGHLPSRDVGHAEEAVGLLPARLAARGPPADRAFDAGGRARWPGTDDEALQPVPQAAGIGVVVVQTHGHGLTRSDHYPCVGRRHALHLRQEIRVDSELQDVHRHDLALELSVGYLVAEGAQGRGPLDPVQEVRAATPDGCTAEAPVEGALVDHVGAVPQDVAKTGCTCRDVAA